MVYLAGGLRYTGKRYVGTLYPTCKQGVFWPPFSSTIIHERLNVLSTNGTRSRKRVARSLIDERIKAQEKIERRREQWRRYNDKRSAKRKALRKTKAVTTRMPKTVLEHLSSGDFPDFRPIEAMGRLGLTNKEIAEVLGVTSETFSRWVKLSSKLKASLVRGRRVADTHVADSLYKQAIGFSVPEEKLFYNAVKDQVVRANTEKYYPPNAVASIFWLKNRYSEFWRERRSSDDKDSSSNGVSIQQVKFVVVQAPRNNGGSEKVIDGDYKILSAK